MKHRNILAERLKERRTKRGLTQKELAEKAGCTNKNISTYESSFRQPEYETLVSLAKALDCSTDFLLGATDIPNRFIGDIDGHHYEIEIDKDEPDKPYNKKQYEDLVKKLESIGFDVDKFMNKTED